MLIWQIAVAVINLVLAVAALIGFRYGMAAIIGVHAKDELDKKDNFAFGIAIAGGALALLLIMSGAISGDAQASLAKEAVNVLMYAALGIILLKVGFVVQDKLIIRGFSIAEEIKSGNIAAAIVMAINLIAVGLVVRTSITWVEGEGISGLLPVLVVFVAMQVVLAAVTAMRVFIYSKRNQGKAWHKAIQEKNIALALRFGGQLLATAIAISSVGFLVNYAGINLFEMLYSWMGLGIAIMIGVWILYRLTFPLVLTKVNIVEEVDQQQNVGVAAIEAALFVGIASLFVGFLA